MTIYQIYDEIKTTLFVKEIYKNAPPIHKRFLNLFTASLILIPVALSMLSHQQQQVALFVMPLIAIAWAIEAVQLRTKSLKKTYPEDYFLVDHYSLNYEYLRYKVFKKNTDHISSHVLQDTLEHVDADLSHQPTEIGLSHPAMTVIIATIVGTVSGKIAGLTSREIIFFISLMLILAVSFKIVFSGHRSKKEKIREFRMFVFRVIKERGEQ